ncbi:MAG: HAD family hydrolase [Planctomycetota bacterium]
MLKAVIFDFDGVITDSEILHFRAFNEVLAPHGIRISKKDYYKTYLGFTDYDLFSLMAEKGMLKLDDGGIRNLVKEKNVIFSKLAQSEGRTIDGVFEFLEMLKENDIPMAICSGALLSEIELILEDAKLRSYFEIIVAAEHVKKGKPYPDGFLLALKMLNEKTSNSFEPAECIAIEDSLWGLKAAKAAGMHRVAVTNSYDSDELNMAEKVVDNLSELNIEQLRAVCGSR